MGSSLGRRAGRGDRAAAAPRRAGLGVPRRRPRRAAAPRAGPARHAPQPRRAVRAARPAVGASPPAPPAGGWRTAAPPADRRAHYRAGRRRSRRPADRWRCTVCRSIAASVEPRTTHESRRVGPTGGWPHERSGLTPQEQFADPRAAAARREDGRRGPADRRAVGGRRWSTAATGPPSACSTATEFHSAAATDDVMRLIDELQNELGEGPCLEASTDDVVQVDNDITDGSQLAARWPPLVLRAHAGARDARCPARRRGHGAAAPSTCSLTGRTRSTTSRSASAAILASFASVASPAPGTPSGRPARGGHGDQPRDRGRRSAS